MAAIVYLLRIREEDSPKTIKKGLQAILEREDMAAAFSSKGLTALKIHFGEADNPKTVSPQFVRTIAEAVKKRKGKPFLADTNTLYTGKRSNSVDHVNLADRHGYNPAKTGCPAIILDGLNGKNFQEIPVGLKHCQTAKIAGDILSIDDLIVITHITGHGEAGLGGSIKNVGMGMASRGGKQKQHSGILPHVDADTCVACGECAKWCPPEAIEVTDIATINPETCIGCGECTVTCPVHAIAVRWDESSRNLQEKMAEYAYAVVNSIKGQACFFNVLIDVTRDCDCMGRPQEAHFPSLGILASTDIAAVDQAAYDLMKQTEGSDIIDTWFGVDALVQVRHAEEIGLGTSTYNLVEV